MPLATRELAEIICQVESKRRQIPALSLIGVNDRARRDSLHDRVDGVSFSTNDRGYGASGPFPDDDDHATLAVLALDQARYRISSHPSAGGGNVRAELGGGLGAALAVEDGGQRKQSPTSDWRPCPLLVKRRSSVAEESVRNLADAGMARISPRQGKQHPARTEIPRESDERAVGISEQQRLSCVRRQRTKKERANGR